MSVTSCSPCNGWYISKITLEGYSYSFPSVWIVPHIGGKGSPQSTIVDINQMANLVMLVYSNN